MSFIENLTSLINQFFGHVNGFLAKLLFFDVLFFLEGAKVPFVVFVLFLGALFFTLRTGFVNLRLFWHALLLTFGFLDKDEKKEGEISHFKALTTALSGTVGLGNIAGVAVAISVGGPGAAFWMIVMGFFAMNVKFSECILGIMYREKRQNGKFMGGPMLYLSKGLKDMGFKKLGTTLSFLFCLCCILGSFGGGVAFQVNQSLGAIAISFPFLQSFKWLYGLGLMFLVALVIIGGIKRIAKVASRIVPLMFLIYMGLCFFVLFSHFSEIPQALLIIIKSAFSFEAGYGGFLGVLITGIQRAAFSNESGLGSSPIAHSAAKVDHPAEEASVALLEPFFDTIIVCTSTALVIILTGVYSQVEFAELVQNQKGAALTSAALGQVNSFFPYLLSLVVFLFAFSTILSWSYYGERSFCYLFGEKRDLIYKIGVLVMIFLGAVATSKNIMEFCDLSILSMSLPNLLGAFLLSGKVKKSMKEYIKKIKVKAEA